MPGSRIELAGRMLTSKESRVSALLIADAKPKLLSLPAAPFQAIDAIRQQFRLVAISIGGDAASLIPGLVIGDTSLQSSQLKMAMRSAGLSHLTAVSGANFAIVSGVVIWSSAWFFRRRVAQSVLTFLLLLCFVVLVQPSPSVLRAAVMASVALIARSTGDLTQSCASLAIAVSALLLIDPLQATDPGFILSVLATSALIFLAPHIERRLGQYLWRWLAESIAISSAATIVCAPYILLLSGEISTATILFNLAVAPAIAPLTIIGLVAALIAPLFPQISILLLHSVLPLSQWIVAVAFASSHVPSLVAAPLVLVFLTLLIGLAIRRGIALAVCGALIIYLFSSRTAFPGHDWRVGQCDIGQGDALVVRVSKDSAILFDAGPDGRKLLQCLHRFSIKKLPLVVISHHHADHFEGLRGLRGITIGEVITNSSTSAEVLAGYLATSVIHPARYGEELQISNITLRMLWPGNLTTQFAAIAGDGSKENNLSVVTEVLISGVRVLITGDIEPGVQREIARLYDLSSVSILKVAHHGSRYQAEEFLREVAPAISLISVGADNPYGHPALDTIQALELDGSHVYRTDRDGAIAISWRGGRGSEESQDKYVFSAKREGKEWWTLRWR